MPARGGIAAVVVLVSVLATSGDARADVTVTITPGPGADFAADLGINLQELETQIGDELRDAFNTLRPKDYLRAFSDAQAFSAKGLGADYATNPTFISVGVAGNFTVGFGDRGFDEGSNDERPVVGLAINVAIMAGVNLGVFKPKLSPMTAYVSFFMRNTNLDEFQANLRHVGAHLQYKLLRPKNKLRNLLVQWGGLDVTGGFEFNSYSLRLERIRLTDHEVGSTGQGIVTFTSRGRFELKAVTFSLPIEVSTNLRLLYVLSVFGGMGIDLQLGFNDLDIGLDGTLVGEDLTTNEKTELGTARVEASESAGPSPGKVRFFGGVQLNAWRAKLFIQGNVAPDRAVGLTFGARVAW